MSWKNLEESFKRISEKKYQDIFLLLGIVFILSIVLVKIRFCHTEVILSVYKYLNPSFLSGDFYLDSLGTYHSQFYFSVLVGFFVKLFNSSPEIVLGFFATFSKLLTILSIFYFGKKLSGNSNKIGILTAMFSLIALVAIGGWSLLLDYSRPWSLIHPLLIFGITFMVQKRIILSAISFGVASIFHPLLGGVVGGLCLFSSYLEGVFKRKNINFLSRIFPAEYLISFFIFLAFFLLNLIPALNSLNNFRLPIDKFLEIVSYRIPAHILPSTWPFKMFLDFILICASSVLMILRTKNQDILKTRTKLFIIGLFSLMIGGYLFVEVFPLRIWVSLIGFRYSSFIYLFFIFILAEFFEKDVLQNKNNLIWQILFFFAYFVLWEASAVFLTLICYLYFNNKYSKWILSGIFVGLLFILNWSMFRLINFLLIIFFIVGINFYDKIKKINLKNYLKVIILFLIISIILVSFFITDIHKIMNKEEYDIAYATSILTPENATILIPIDLELVRTEGNRRVFVGQEFPFLDKYMEEWYKRAVLAWGKDAFEKVWANDLNRNYKKMNDSQRDYIHEEYGVEYAILFVETETNSSIVYSNDKYKIISLINK